MKMSVNLGWGPWRVREAAGAGENHPSLAPVTSRHAFWFPGNNLRSADSSSPWSFKHPLEATLSAFLRRWQAILSQRPWKIHRAVLDAENLQPHSGNAVENQIILKTIHAPGTDVLQIPDAKFPQPAFQRLQCQIFTRAVNCLEETQRGCRIIFSDDWKYPKASSSAA